MAGIGFELKKLFKKSGLAAQPQELTDMPVLSAPDR